MSKKIHLNFNSGFLEYGKVETLRDGRKKKNGQTFKSKGGLYFDYKDIRQRDIELYQTSEQKLNLKVKTYYIPETVESHKVKIGDDLYNITHVDPDKDKTVMYWYLSKLGDQTT